ncbi:MAG: NADP-dependent oxidoreductase [Gaiellales bacterium]
MRAVRYHDFGDAEVMRVEEAPEVHAGPGQIRIAVRSTSVNPADLKFRAGLLQDYRPTTFPAIPGMDAAGIVDEIGAGVTGLAVGDRVLGLTATGGAAEHAVLKAWAPLPQRWSFAHGAAAGITGHTVLLALDALGPLSGRAFLVEGAAGGVGTAAVELAADRGATVIGTASEHNHEFLRSLGAIPTIYGDGLPQRVAALAPDGVAAVLDTVGSGSLGDLIAIAGDAAAVVTLADYSGPERGVRLVGGEENMQENLAALAAAGERGTFTPQISVELPLEDIVQAHQHVAGGHTRGKVVLAL